MGKRRVMTNELNRRPWQGPPRWPASCRPAEATGGSRPGPSAHPEQLWPHPRNALQAHRGVVKLRPARPVEQCTPALTAVPGPQQELGGVALEQPISTRLDDAGYGALVARLLGGTGVGPGPPELPPLVVAVTRHAADGRRRRCLINHGTESVPLPEPAHDLLTGGKIAELAAGGSAVLRFG